jgi:hypothetical protein
MSNTIEFCVQNLVTIPALPTVERTRRALRRHRMMALFFASAGAAFAVRVLLCCKGESCMQLMLSHSKMHMGV